ncbi:DUF1499 domain-containing protein [Vibrio algarum]|uniref:DUF1499 domain-containing protein n=1 Tax=Vibrio algarum TaxID=3020714 RepID=A0ABT4YZ88_9VIBR|nr:DUF1499 domain-containing protein [Vibrio sp. KJ40-1]MDB1126268.1 DUF1499 domain-containing protein [Vibrio sp. KJ40-1]
MIYKIALVLIVVLVAFMFYKNNVTPSYIGVADGQLSPMPSSPNAVSSQTDVEDKKVAPFTFNSIDDAKKNVKRVFAQLPSNSVELEREDYLHVIFTTETMKFHDDVELYFDEKNKLIHYRSQSRVGYSDRGLNKARYEQFSELYNGLK